MYGTIAKLLETHSKEDLIDAIKTVNAREVARDNLIEAVAEYCLAYGYIDELTEETLAEVRKDFTEAEKLIDKVFIEPEPESYSMLEALRGALL